MKHAVLGIYGMQRYIYIGTVPLYIIELKQSAFNGGKFDTTDYAHEIYVLERGSCWPSKIVVKYEDQEHSQEQVDSVDSELKTNRSAVTKEHRQFDITKFIK